MQRAYNQELNFPSQFLQDVCKPQILLQLLLLALLIRLQQSSPLDIVPDLIMFCCLLSISIYFSIFILLFWFVIDIINSVAQNKNTDIRDHSLDPGEHTDRALSHSISQMLMTSVALDFNLQQ